MNLFTLRLTALTALCAGVALVALLAAGLAARASTSEGPIQLLAVDTDPTGNTATSVGDVEACSEMQVGDQYEVDVIVKGVPEVTGEAGGLTGFDFSIDYDQRYVRIVDVQATDQFLNAASGSSLVDFTDAVPDDDGSFHVALADFGDNADESGDGVLARITLEGVGVGTSEFNFAQDIVFFDSRPVVATDQYDSQYDFEMIQNGLIKVGVECVSDDTPAPAPTPTPTPAPTESGSTESPGASATPVPTNPDGSTVTPGPTNANTPGPGNTGGATNTPEDGDSGSSTIIIVAVVVTAALLALAAAGYVALRRRGGTQT